jgi:prepilin-type N-terminal cleavage/methylation domain-containing protein/prepilin-type processing-associated H-X9-DG protein
LRNNHPIGLIVIFQIFTDLCVVKNLQATSTVRKSPNGFTLTEILVVIVIIASVASFGFAGMRSMRQSADTAKCMDTLRKWGIAIHGHAADNSGLVRWSSWASIGKDDTGTARYYEAYFGGDGDSPTVEMGGKLVLATQYHRKCPTQIYKGEGNGPVGYSMVRPNPKVGNDPHYNLSKASSPSQLLLMIDGNALNIGAADEMASKVVPLCLGKDSRHGNKVNALFGDGHVASYRARELDVTRAAQLRMMERWFNLNW